MVVCNLQSLSEACECSHKHLESMQVVELHSCDLIESKHSSKLDRLEHCLSCPITSYNG